MMISVIIPIGRRDVFLDCRRSVCASIAKCDADVKWEIIEVFDDEHKGVSWARNEGLKRVKGDWIAWVDCDDVVMDSWASIIATHILNEKTSTVRWDVLAFGANSVRKGRRVEIRISSFPHIMSPYVFLRGCILDNMGSTWLWNKVFRRTLFHGLEFSGRTQEDFRIIPRLISRSRMVAVIPELLYEYRRPTGSLTHGGGGFVNAEGIILAINDDLCDIKKSNNNLSKIWKEGCVLRASDWLYHSGYNKTLYRFLLKNIHRVLLDGTQSIRIKIKCILSLFRFV